MRPYFERGGVTLYHGDCREVLPSIEPADAIITDPPYGIGFAAQPTKWQRRAGHEARAWDDATVDGVESLIAKARVQVVWGGNYYRLPASRGWLCWFKPDAPPSMGNFELAWTNQDQNARLISYSISATNPERVGHPTQKPVAVMVFAIRSVPEASPIVDPFAGSGSTLVAAYRLGRRAIGVEIEEAYCEIAAKRLEREMAQGDLFKRGAA